jgi:hypothetical protein
MKASCLLYSVQSGTQIEMVCVCQYYFSPDILFQYFPADTFTLPEVPTGMNTGVRILPLPVDRIPVLALE